MTRIETHIPISRWPSGKGYLQYPVSCKPFLKCFTQRKHSNSKSEQCPEQTSKLKARMDVTGNRWEAGSGSGGDREQLSPWPRTHAKRWSMTSFTIMQRALHVQEKNGDKTRDFAWKRKSPTTRQQRRRRQQLCLAWRRSYRAKVIDLWCCQKGGLSATTAPIQDLAYFSFNSLSTELHHTVDRDGVHLDPTQ